MSRQSIFANKSILITGGTGSFGQALARRLLTEDQCKKVIILSRDEWKQWEMQNKDPIFRHPKIRLFLGDVRDHSRLTRAFRDVDYVVHAAALKHVPIAEYNPTEFIKTNIQGAMNVIDAAINCGVKKVIALSTDKAVNPANLYGATKLCSDKLFCAGNVYVGAPKSTELSVVRYGNVLGSRGSLVPYWRKLIADGATELPITDIRMTRFWITLEQSVDFVMRCFEEMYGGEIFVPKIPSMKILDLAEAMAPGLGHKISGIRPGEKLHELMVSSEDTRHSLEFPHSYIIVPETHYNDPALLKQFLGSRKGTVLPENFSYGSNTNTQWLSKEDLQRLLAFVP
jgi:UDP-N-acetylglucosamine 4,6-dehydratase/5-epimerase